MPLDCKACGQRNRDQARYCKRCGAPLASQSTDQLLGSLVGLDPIREALQDLKITMEGMRRNNVQASLPYDTLIVGNSGTAKTLIGGLITGLLHRFGRIGKAAPLVIDALLNDTLKPDDLDKNFDAAKGGVLFIDNAHRLFTSDGSPTALMNRLIRLIDGSPLDPVVILAGLPFGMNEFLQKPENRSLTGRFQNTFQIPDYSAVQLAQIARHKLEGDGFTLAPDTVTRLERRMRWLHRAALQGSDEISALNGHLAMREAQAISREYYKRQATDHILLPADIRGEIEEKKSIEAILAELDGFIGMDNIKAEVRALHQDLEHQRRLVERGLVKARDMGFHFTLTGNPGTGKTTVARALGEIFEALGVLPSGHLREVDRSNLVAQFQGQTAPLVNRMCDQAMGGVLFIDEAYALKQSDNDSFGQEAVDTLLKRMEDDLGKLIVIAAGYKTNIEDFLQTNPGLKSRFNKHFHLNDYTPEELAAIFAQLARKRGYSVDATGKAAVTAYFEDRCARKTADFANGREARNLLDDVLRSQQERLRRDRILDDDALVTITGADIPVASASKGDTAEAALAELDTLVGLGGVKQAVHLLRQTLEAQRLVGESEVLARHFVFTGNPGTGKTTVARILARILHAIGLLPGGQLIETDRGKLVAGFVGQTAINVHAMCDKAMGGVLFVDEAYALKQGAQDSFGQEAIDTLLKRMEDDRGKFVVIAAGYTREMENFLDSNSGLRSRFSDIIEFEDYGPADMVAIFKGMATKKGITWDEAFTDALASRFSQIHEKRGKSFANARSVRQMFDKTVGNRNSRVLGQTLDDDAKRLALRIFLVEDLDQTILG